MNVARPLAALLAVFVLATAAWAQGYVVETATGRLETRPATATRVAVDSVHAAKAAASVRLPFAFWFYGARCTTAVVSAHGWLVPGGTTGFADAGDPAAAHGQDATSHAFPYGRGTASADGVVAPLWTTLAAVDDGTPGAGA